MVSEDSVLMALIVGTVLEAVILIKIQHINSSVILRMIAGLKQPAEMRRFV